MAGYPPTCSACGAILTGYGWSRELNFPVYFCPRCRAKADAAGGDVKERAAPTEVMDKAA